MWQRTVTYRYILYECRQWLLLPLTPAVPMTLHGSTCRRPTTPTAHVRASSSYSWRLGRWQIEQVCARERERERVHARVASGGGARAGIDGAPSPDGRTERTALQAYSPMATRMLHAPRCSSSLLLTVVWWCHWYWQWKDLMDQLDRWRPMGSQHSDRAGWCWIELMDHQVNSTRF